MAPQRKKNSGSSAATPAWVKTDDGLELYSEATGQGPVLICCNGILCTDHYWKYLRPYFEHDYKIVVWDYRAHGRSPQPNSLDDMTIEQMAHDLHCVVEHHAPDGAVFLGHSMGAQVLLEYWEHNPAHVRGMVPICGTFRKPAETLALPFAAQLVPGLLKVLQDNTVLFDLINSTVASPRLMFEVARSTGAIHPELCRYDDMKPYFDHISRLKSAPMFSLFSDLFDHDTEHILPTITAPTLIVAGEKDTLTPPHMSEQMRQRIKSSQLMMVPQGSHTALFEHPELINLRLEKFLREML